MSAAARCPVVVAAVMCAVAIASVACTARSGSPSVDAPAPAGHGRLRVRVVDDRDVSPIPGATVTLSAVADPDARESVQSDIDGVAIFPSVPAGGGYVLSVSFPGYAPARERGVRVEHGETVDHELRLVEQLAEPLIPAAPRDAGLPPRDYATVVGGGVSFSGDTDSHGPRRSSGTESDAEPADMRALLDRILEALAQSAVLH